MWQCPVVISFQQKMDLTAQTKKIFSGDIKTDDQTLQSFSKDASLFKIKPQVVVFPKTVEDIKNLVKFVSSKHEHHLSLTARSGGTDMTGGPLSQSIVVSMTKYFNHIKKIGRDFAVTEPGVYYRDFEKETLKHNLLLPSYPASREICTVGGMAANNSGGELNLLYGKTERYIRELKMVCADGKEYTFKNLTVKALASKMKLKGFEGEIYRGMFKLIDKNYDSIQSAKPKVTKNSAGYYLWNVYEKEKQTFDLTKMIVGSQGTLGIITEIKFGLVKPKKREHLLVILMNDLNILPDITNHLLKFKPQSIESYDDKTFKVALKLLPDIVARLKGNVFKLFLSFIPELFMALRGGLPKLVLLAEFSADKDKDAVLAAKEAQASLSGFKVSSKLILSEADAQKYWVIRRESFNLLRHHVRGMRTAPFIDDFVVDPKYLGEFLPRLYQILNRYNLLYTIAGHVGDGNFHIIPLMKLGTKNAADIIKRLSDEVYDLVFEYHGSTSGEHNDGLIRGKYLEKMYGEKVYNLFLQTKNIFDPHNIFNPGKKVGVHMGYALEHLDFK